MGKSYMFVASNRVKALAMGNAFMSRCRAIGKRCKPFPPRQVMSGNYNYTVDVCGPADSRVDRIAEEMGK